MNSLLHRCSRKEERDECQLQLLMLMEALLLQFSNSRKESAIPTHYRSEDGNLVLIKREDRSISLKEEGEQEKINKQKAKEQKPLINCL